MGKLPKRSRARQKSASEKTITTHLVNTFSELGLNATLLKKLTANGFHTPTPVQAAAIPHGMSGKDIFATAQTGTGKTLAFLLPALERLQKQPHAAGHVSVLVLVPTRELAIQVLEEHTKLASPHAKAALVIGGASEHTQLKQLRAGARLIVATPGRLEDYLERKLVKLDHVEMLVLDEADRMLDMGFIPAVRRIVRCLPKRRQNLCFSATADPNVTSQIEDLLIAPVRLAFGSTLKAADKVRLQAYEVDRDQKAALLARVIRAEEGQSLVFVATKRSSERVAKRLAAAGVTVAVIHGDRSQSQRNSALQSFQRGHAQVLVATDLASRGIHVDEIAHVVNYDLPNIPEDFVHRAGRTGRMGASGVATTFFTPIERRDFANLERQLKVKMERLQAGADLERDPSRRMAPVDASRLRWIPAPNQRGGVRAGQLEGEVLRKYTV